MINKAIIMAGGSGTRLKPLTNYLNKHLLPVYNKPMIFYPLSLLIYAKVKEILIICNQEDLKTFRKILFSYQKKYKILIKFKIQTKKGGGIAEGLILGKNFLSNAKKFALILGDNFFFGKEFPKILNTKLNEKSKNSCVFLSKVSDPKNYGVAYLNKKKEINKIIEKPKNPKSSFVITGLYVYHVEVLRLLKQLKPSKRGELEITSLNKILLKQKKLDYVLNGRGTTWFDLGTYDNIYQCSEFVKLIETRQGLKIFNL